MFPDLGEVPLYCCSVDPLCPTFCNSMDYSKPGLPVPHHIPEFSQVHVHFTGDAVQPSHPLMPFSPSALDLSQHLELLQQVSLFSAFWSSNDQDIGASVSLSVFPVGFQDWSPLGSTILISLLSKGLSGVFSSTIVQRHQSFGILPSLGSSSHNWIDYWEDHSLDYIDLCCRSNVSVFQHTI